MHYMNDILQNYTKNLHDVISHCHHDIFKKIAPQKQCMCSSLPVELREIKVPAQIQTQSCLLPTPSLSVINPIKAGRERSLACTPSREVLPPAPPASGACWTHLSPIPLSETSCGWLETSHDGRIYTLEISKCYKAGLPFPLKKVHLPAHDCPILLYIPSTKKAKGYISFQPRFVSYQAQRSYKALNQYFILLGGKLKQF